MKEVERLFWVVGLLLLLPFAVQQGFKINSAKHLEVPILQSAVATTPSMLGNGLRGWDGPHEETRALGRPASYQLEDNWTHQRLISPEGLIARLTVPALQIDLPVFAGNGKAGNDRAEVINAAADLDSEHHIGLATCFAGDPAALVRRARGELLLLQTDNRLRQYHIIDARLIDPLQPRLLANLDFGSITLVSCSSISDPSGQLLVITAMETDNIGRLYSASTAHTAAHFKF